MNPFRYRPAYAEPAEIYVDPDPDEEILDWEDNWLSNGMAWFSHTFMPRWCNSEEHWTASVANYLWAECPCCLLWRGLALGAIGGGAIGLVVGITI